MEQITLHLICFRNLIYKFNVLIGIGFKMN